MGSDCSICHLPFEDPNGISRTTCPFCNRTFSRVDAARRHAKVCRAKGDRALPDTKRGRKARACDACSRIKVSCNAKDPCRRCSSRGLACTYGHRCTNSAHRQGSGQDAGLQESDGSLSGLRFLLMATDPRVDFVSEVFVDGEPAERDPATASAWNQFPDSSPRHDTIDPRLLLLGFMDQWLDFPPDCDDSQGLEYSTDMPLTLPPIPDDDLTPRIRVLEAGLQELAQMRPNLNEVTFQEAFQEFFACDNFHRLVSVFFRRQRLLANMIHWATFDLSKVDVSLLLAIALCGAAHSYKPAEPLSLSIAAPAIRELAEKYIFKQLKQRRGGHGSESALQVCQAAHLTIALQFSVNDIDARRRVIHKRQPALVDALRRLGLMRNSPSTSVMEANWRSFVYQESCIRLAAGVCFTDGLLALFCNVPPNSTVSELSGGPFCRDELWSADSPTSFAAQQMRPDVCSQPPSVKDLLAALLDETWDEASYDGHQSLTCSHLHATMGALQIVLFNFRANMLPRSFASVLLRALDRWERLWQVAMDRVPNDQQGWLGIIEHSPEFALISKRIVDVSHTGEGKLSSTVQLERRVNMEHAELPRKLSHFCLLNPSNKLQETFKALDSDLHTLDIFKLFLLHPQATRCGW